MRERNEYSDEYINSYIDGELDYDDRARLLFDEQDNDELAQRINEARILKEKIQLAYSDLPTGDNTNKPFSCTAFVSRHRSLAASLIVFIAVTAFLLPALMKNDDVMLAKQLIKSTQSIAVNTIGDAIGSHKQIVINISQYQPQGFDTALDDIEEILLKNSADKSFNIEIVANKTGLRALDTETSLHAERISQLAKKYGGLEVVACAKSLAKLASEGDSIQLLKSILITPSAAQQVAKRTGQGWHYLKI